MKTTGLKNEVVTTSVASILFSLFVVAIGNICFMMLMKSCSIGWSKWNLDLAVNLDNVVVNGTKLRSHCHKVGN